MPPDSNDGCSWCGRALDPADCWLLAEAAAGREAAFCRLEHVVPWAIRGPRWRVAESDLPDAGGAAIVLVRRRGGHVIVEGFASLDEAVGWAKAGGPWAG